VSARELREKVKVSEARSGREPTEILVGIIGRAHGLKGDVAIEVRTDEPERRFVGGALLRVEDSERTFRVESVRWHGGRLVVRFAELADRTAAEQARGARLVTDVDPDERPSDPEEYYDRQLVGLSVLDAAGSTIGTVGAVLHLPEQDLLEIIVAGETRLVPFVGELVPEVDLAAGTVRLADVPGLLGDLD
jgi:16S rRNA processing protein RimM